MKPTVLQPDQRQSFDENGYLVVPGALTATEVEALTQISDRMIEQFDRAENQPYVQLRPGIVEEPAFHPLLAHDATLPLVVQGSCFEYGCAGTDFRGSGLAALQQACPGATLTQLGPLGEWDYRGSSSKETEAEARQRAWRVASWLQAEGLAQARGGAVVLVAHATFLDLLLQILVDGTDKRWRYGEPTSL